MLFGGRVTHRLLGRGEYRGHRLTTPEYTERERRGTATLIDKLYGWGFLSLFLLGLAASFALGAWLDNG